MLNLDLGMVLSQGVPWSIPLQALSQSCLMVVMMMVAQRCSQWEMMMVIMIFTGREGVSY